MVEVELVMVEVVGVVLSVALVVVMVVQVEAHKLLGEVLTTQHMLSPDRN